MNCLAFLSVLILFPFSLYAQEEINCSWIDFPKQPLVFYLETPNPTYEEVDNIISTYHKMDKTNEKKLKERAEILECLSLTLQQASTIPEDKKGAKTLQKLSSIAMKKAHYLKSLNSIYLYGLDSFEEMENRYGGLIEKQGYTALPLINKILYGTNLPSYWGLFWLEALDPCHRMLTPYYIKWKEQERTVPFFMWLEEQEIPYYTPQIKLFTEEELALTKYTVFSQNGLIYDIKGRKPTLNEEKEEYIYVLSLERNFYITKADTSIRHFSLSGGKPVLAAGALKINEGKIVYLDGESGHYQPTVFDICQAIHLFKELGVIFEETLPIKYYLNQEVYQVPLSQFLAQFSQKLTSLPFRKRYLSDFRLR